MNLAHDNADYGHAIADDRNHVWHHLTQYTSSADHDPMVVVEGRGLTLKDARGREYLDATSGGVWTVNVGYGREEIADAVREQLVTMCYFAHTAGSVPHARFSERLIDKMPGMSRVYFSNSGSEANRRFISSSGSWRTCTMTVKNPKSCFVTVITTAPRWAR